MSRDSDAHESGDRLTGSDPTRATTVREWDDDNPRYFPVEFGWLDWIEGQNVQARARVALRRAGVLLFMWDKKDGVTRNPDEYRIEVDTMLTGIQDFIGTLDQAAFDETKRLYETANTVRTDKSPESLNREIIRVLSKSNARTALFSILVAMGHSGGILRMARELP